MLSHFYSLDDIKMLIIDDDEGLCNSLKYFFEDHDCNVTTAKCAEMGIMLFYRVKPDIVLVDLNMPGIGGHDFISSISREYPHIPIIVVSGTGIIKEVIRSINLGAWDFVTKPILDFEDLEFSVLKALEKAALIQENKKYKLELEKLVDERTAQLNHKTVELEQLVAKYKKAKENAEAADRLKSEFLSQMSHELRTPMNWITGYEYMAKESYESNNVEEVFDYFEKIRTAGNRIVRTFELMLLMSEVTSGLYVPTFEVHTLEEIVDSVCNSYKPILNNKSLNLTFTCTSKASNVLIDKYSVEQILNNVIDNAVKFTSKGRIDVRLYQQNGILFVEVEDTGVGIAEEYMKNLYKPFSQEEQGYGRKYEGNGLGLALSKKYSELNKIDIQIESMKNIGTKVKLIFRNN